MKYRALILRVSLIHPEIAKIRLKAVFLRKRNCFRQENRKMSEILIRSMTKRQTSKTIPRVLIPGVLKRHSKRMLRAMLNQQMRFLMVKYPMCLQMRKC